VVDDYVGPKEVAQPENALAGVTWSIDGEHTALIELENTEDEAPYRFKVKVIAVFSFDFDIAVSQYKVSSGIQLPKYIAVNIVRILYAGAREHIAMMTARAPLGALMLQSVLFEPKDIEVGSIESPAEILSTIFRASPEELRAIEAKWEQSKGEVEPDAKGEGATPKRKLRRKAPPPLKQ
jgi:hypothetical protein